MSKSLLFAAFCVALAPGVYAQSTSSPDPAAPSADTRAADLNKMMEIRNWQAGPSAGDAAAKADASAPAPAADTRAKDLNNMMEIRNWQAGPSTGDATAKIDPSKSEPLGSVTLGSPGAQDQMQHESTP